MIAFDLVCQPARHVFEGWFASSSEFDRQSAMGLVACPVCASADVGKAVMAPNIARKATQQRNGAAAPAEAETAAVSNLPDIPPEMTETIAKLAKIQDKMLEKSEWVGRQFAEEARAIHYGEQPGRSIHGEATAKEAGALHEEGISVAPLPLPFIPPEAKN